jgi:hypothetical protein
MSAKAVHDALRPVTTTEIRAMNEELSGISVPPPCSGTLMNFSSRVSASRSRRKPRSLSQLRRADELKHVVVATGDAIPPRQRPPFGLVWAVAWRLQAA